MYNYTLIGNIVHKQKVLVISSFLELQQQVLEKRLEWHVYFLDFMT